MCGIIGIISKKPVIKDLVDGLGKLRYRGYDSVGIVLINNGELVINKAIGDISNLKVDLSDKGVIALGHSRWATHGKVSVENAHPHTDCNKELAIVHNGIIENFEELKEKLISMGHKFKSQTDSEVIAHLIEMHLLKENFKVAFELAVKELQGSYAIVALHKEYDYLMIARKDSPLLIGISDDVYVSSDIVALNGKDVREVSNDSIECIKLGEYKSEKITKVNDVLVDKNGYPHFMLKEIYEQPDVIHNALKQDKSKLIEVSFDILRAKNVILTACGTSRHAAIVGRYLISKFAQKMCELVVGSELHYFADSFGDSTLILAISQSGETEDVLNGVRLAKQKGSKIISLVNRSYSSLERLSDLTLFINCGEEISVASTKAFTNELAIFYLLAFTMANKYEDGIKEVSELSTKIKECLKYVEKIKQVANRIKKAKHAYYIGKGINYAISGECALKLKEISYIHAESMSAGELKHGTLSLIEKGIPVIGLCPDDYTYKETISNLHEVKTRKGLVIGISDKENSVFDYWLPIPKVKDIYYPLVSVVVGQLLAYYVASSKGLNVDFPRNLAKSVTVK